MSKVKRVNLTDSKILKILDNHTDIDTENVEKLKDIENEDQRKGARELAKSLVKLNKHFGSKDFEKAKNLLNDFYGQISGKRAMDRQIIQATKLIKMLGARNNYGEQAWRDLNQKMNENGWSKNYQRFNYYVLKNLARVTQSDWPWYMDPPEKPQEQDLTKPVMSSDILEKAIKKAKTVDMTVNDPGLYDNRAVFCLAISSTYGVRQIEIGRLTPNLIDEKNHEIEIHTAKKGEYRTHLIPEPIRPYVYNFNIGANLGTSKATMSRIFHHIFDRLSSDIRNSGRYDDKNKGDPWGWHSIRRRLITDFENMREGEERNRVFSRAEMINFFRWSEADPTMLSTYARKEKEVEDLDNRVVDEKFLERHPYVDLWED